MTNVFEAAKQENERMIKELANAITDRELAYDEIKNHAEDMRRAEARLAAEKAAREKAECALTKLSVWFKDHVPCERCPIGKKKCSELPDFCEHHIEDWAKREAEKGASDA